MKVNKTQLKELSTTLGAYYCGGNVYTHENITYYITHDYTKLNEYTNNKNDVYNIMEHIAEKTKNILNYYITSTFVAYSAGTYGNTGQLIKYDIINSNDVVDTFYTCYY